MSKLVEAGKSNCWEHKKCGRQPGGARQRTGHLPGHNVRDLNGAHGGQNAGRACWVIAGSLCGGKIQGTYALKLNNCWRCDFMNAVKQEEEPYVSSASRTRVSAWTRPSKKQKHAVGRSQIPMPRNIVIDEQGGSRVGRHRIFIV